MELLPKTYRFSLTYAGSAIEIVQNVSSNSTVTFQTELITVELRDHNGTLLPEGSDLKYRNGSWYDFGGGETTGGTETMELLPKTYRFSLTYAGSAIEIVQNVGSNPTVTFQTTLVTVELRDNSNNLMDTGLNVKYRNGSWYTFGSGSTAGGTVGTVTMDLLPKTYRFSLTYAGSAMEIVQNVGITSTVAFHTAMVAYPGVHGIGQLGDFGLPIVTFDVDGGGMGAFDIMYPTGTGHAREGVEVSGDITCLVFDGSTAYLIGEVTSSNSSEWPVGYFVPFGQVTATNLNYGLGVASSPSCTVGLHTGLLTLASGGYHVEAP